MPEELASVEYAGRVLGEHARAVLAWYQSGKPSVARVQAALRQIDTVKTHARQAHSNVCRIEEQLFRIQKMLVQTL